MRKNVSRKGNIYESTFETDPLRTFLLLYEDVFQKFETTYAHGELKVVTKSSSPKHASPLTQHLSLLKILDTFIGLHGLGMLSCCQATNWQAATRSCVLPTDILVVVGVNNDCPLNAAKCMCIRMTFRLWKLGFGKTIR